MEDVIDTVISIVYLYTRPKRGANKNSIFLTEVLAAVGHGVRNKLKQKRDSSLAAKTGGFFLYSFEELGMIQVIMGSGSKGHGTYLVQVMDDESICKLWSNLE